MKNHSTNFQGPQWKKVYFLGNLQSELTYTLEAGHSSVSNVGALIQGDFHKPNPWKYNVNAQRFFNGDMNTVAGAYRTNDVGVFYSVPLNVPPWRRGEVMNAAVDKLYNEVRGGLDLGVSLAEAGQTARMLRKSFALVNFVRSIPRLGPLVKRLRNLLNDPRSHNVEFEAVSLAKQIADLFLEYQFGWKPLISDIYDAADESVRVVLNKIQDFNVRARLPMENPEKQSVRELREVGGVENRYNTEAIQQCIISISMEVPSWDPARWSSLNPVSIAWELMPYSFVVDWLYDIGGTLRRFESSLLYDTKFKNGYTSELYRYSTAYRQTTFKSASGTSHFGRLFASIRDVRFERALLASMPAGRLPSVRANLGSTQLLETAALLSQFILPEKVWKSRQMSALL